MEVAGSEQREIALGGLVDRFLTQSQRLIEIPAAILDLEQQVPGVAVAHPPSCFLVAAMDDVLQHLFFGLDSQRVGFLSQERLDHGD